MQDEESKVSEAKTSRGIPWSEVKLDEAEGMVRDGIEAAALLAAIRLKAGEEMTVHPEDEMIFDPAVKAALVGEVARETGRPFHVVEQAFNLMLEVHDIDAHLGVWNGKVMVVVDPIGHREPQLPSSLVCEIADSYDDLAVLLDPLYRACGRATGMVS
jgi:hypothetical protein